MGYNADRIEVRRVGRFCWIAKIIYVDDGVPDEECPLHGWDPPRGDHGTLLLDGVPWHKATRAAAKGCRCPAQTGSDLQQSGYGGITHKRAWRKARRAIERERKYG